jgi:hypothetical protein
MALSNDVLSHSMHSGYYVLLQNHVICYKVFCQIMKNCIKTCLETICTFLKCKYLGRIITSTSTGYQN